MTSSSASAHFCDLDGCRCNSRVGTSHKKMVTLVIAVTADLQPRRPSIIRKVGVDGSGNVFIADTGNHRVRKIDAGGITNVSRRQSEL